MPMVLAHSDGSWKQNDQVFMGHGVVQADFAHSAIIYSIL